MLHQAKRHPDGWRFVLLGGASSLTRPCSLASPKKRFALPPQSASSLLVSGKASNIAHRAKSLMQNATQTGGFLFCLAEHQVCGLRPPDRWSRRLHNQAKPSLNARESISSTKQNLSGIAARGCVGFNCDYCNIFKKTFARRARYRL